MSKLIGKLIVCLINVYQIFSSYFPKRCRFYPSCSQYGKESVEKFGPFYGIIKFFKRIIKCHPFHPGGFDPVN